MYLHVGVSFDTDMVGCFGPMIDSGFFQRFLEQYCKILRDKLDKLQLRFSKHTSGRMGFWRNV